MKKGYIFYSIFVFYFSVGAQPTSDAVTTQSHDVDPLKAELQHIESEKLREDARFSSASTACYQHFAVEDCLIQNRKKRREVLAVLRNKEIAFNDSERKRAAFERKRLAAKQGQSPEEILQAQKEFDSKL